MCTSAWHSHTIEYDSTTTINKIHCSIDISQPFGRYHPNRIFYHPITSLLPQRNYSYVSSRLVLQPADNTLAMMLLFARCTPPLRPSIYIYLYSTSFGGKRIDISLKISILSIVLQSSVKSSIPTDIMNIININCVFLLYIDTK